MFIGIVHASDAFHIGNNQEFGFLAEYRDTQKDADDYLIGHFFNDSM